MAPRLVRIRSRSVPVSWSAEHGHWSCSPDGFSVNVLVLMHQGTPEADHLAPGEFRVLRSEPLGYSTSSLADSHEKALNREKRREVTSENLVGLAGRKPDDISHGLSHIPQRSWVPFLRPHTEARRFQGSRAGDMGYAAPAC